MAYDANNPLDDEEKKAQENGGSGGGLITGSGPAPSSQAQSRSSDGTGEYTPLVKYLEANQQRHQGVDLANKVGSDVDAAQASQSALGNEFRSSADKATVNADSGLLDEVKSSPTSVASDPTKKANFESEYSASYNGPSVLDDLDGYAGARNATTNAEQASTNSKTESGKTALLDQYYSRPNYTGGEKALDQYLLSNDAEAPDAFSKVQSRGENLENEWNQLLGGTQAYAQSAKDKTAATAQAAKQTVNDAVNSREKNINDEVASRLAQYDTQIPQAKQSLINALSPDAVKALGDVSKFLNIVPRSNVNPSSVANQNDYDEMNALAELAGQENTFLTSPQSAGSMASTPFYSYDTGGLQTALNIARDNEIKNTSVKVDQPQGPVNMNIQDAISYLTPYYNQAVSYLADLQKKGIDPAKDSSGSTQTVAAYQALQSQLAGIQKKYAMPGLQTFHNPYARM